MKHFVHALVALFLGAVATSQQTAPKQSPTMGGDTAVVYAEGGAFSLEAPKGWITDRETGQKNGVCCVWYPEGSTWDSAETVIYPNITTKSSGQKTLDEFMESDLAGFREHDPELTYEVGGDIPLKENRIAKLRLFYNVNHGSSEAVAYVDEEKIIAVVVMSSKTKKNLSDSIPLLRTLLQSYTFVNLHVVKEPQQKKSNPVKLPKE
jgi:hypothetical protein